jgi:itaconate CoA-transferase
MRPLAGITVVTLEHAIAAPFATRQLADLGARVIKVERPGVGDLARGYDERVRGLASHFVWTNRSKESLTLDVKHPEAQAILKRLVQEQADVVIQNLAPGAAARLGLSWEVLSPAKPGLIVCDISGYGADGPYRDKKAYDLLIQSEAGFLSITGTPEEPSKAGLSIADIAAGMYAYSSILAALLQRQKTGLGQCLDISMLESLVEWMSYPLYYAFDGAAPPPRTGASHATIYPYGPFPAGDGKTVMLGLQNEREWGAFCAKVMLQPELATEPRFATNSKRSGARRTARPDRRCVRVADRRRGAAAARRRADRQRPGQRHARCLAAPAIARAQALARDRFAVGQDSRAAAARILGRPGAENGRCAGAWPAHGCHSRKSRLFRGRDRRTEAGTCDLIRNLAPQ